MKRKVISLLMVGLLLFGMCGTAFAEESQDDYYSIIFNEIMRTSPWLGENVANWTTNAILYACDEWGVDPLLATAVFKQESGFSMEAMSPVGAVGVAQLMPGTAEGLGVDPYNPLENIEGGVHYLKIQLDRFSGAGQWKATYAVAAYNAGPGAVQKYGGVPPYSETTNYVNSISRIYQGLSS